MSEETDPPPLLTAGSWDEGGASAAAAEPSFKASAGALATVASPPLSVSDVSLLSPQAGHFLFSTRSRIFHLSEGGGFDLGNLPSMVMVEAKLLIRAVQERQTRRWACIFVRDEGGRPPSRKSEDRSLTRRQSISLRLKILAIRLLIPIFNTLLTLRCPHSKPPARIDPVRRWQTCH